MRKKHSLTNLDRIQIIKGWATYSSKQNDDETYTINLSPTGKGLNGLKTGKPFYGILRAYVPAPGANMTAEVEKK